MLQITDYVGMVSGAQVEKSTLFRVVDGVLEYAPMIADCPVSMQCRLVQTVALGHHEIFIGEVVETFVLEECLTDEKSDLDKIDPLLFDFMRIDYWSIGTRTGKPWRDGKILVTIQHYNRAPGLYFKSNTVVEKQKKSLN